MTLRLRQYLRMLGYLGLSKGWRSIMKIRSHMSQRILPSTLIIRRTQIIYTCRINLSLGKDQKLIRIPSCLRTMGADGLHQVWALINLGSYPLHLKHKRNTLFKQSTLNNWNPFAQTTTWLSKKNSGRKYSKIMESSGCTTRPQGQHSHTHLRWSGKCWREGKRKLKHKQVTTSLSKNPQFLPSKHSSLVASVKSHTLRTQ